MSRRLVRIYCPSRMLARRLELRRRRPGKAGECLTAGDVSFARHLSSPSLRGRTSRVRQQSAIDRGNHIILTAIHFIVVPGKAGERLTAGDVSFARHPWLTLNETRCGASPVASMLPTILHTPRQTGIPLARLAADLSETDHRHYFTPSIELHREEALASARS